MTKKPTTTASPRKTTKTVAPVDDLDVFALEATERDELFSTLRELATDARSRAYAPYSNYRVGAALVTRSGRVFLGCNVENATYGATTCAERGAVQQMVAAGEREIAAIAIATGGDEPGAPCGICRQVLREFAQDLPIELFNVPEEKRTKQKVVATSLAALLPLSFGPEMLVEDARAKGAPVSTATKPAKSKKK